MKRIFTTLLVLLVCAQGYSNNFYFAWDGYGMATHNNYNLGMSYGAYYYHGVGRGVGLGTLECYQTFNMYYSRERTAAVGTTLQSDITYRFFSPMAVFQLDKRQGRTQVYATGGIGELQGGSTLTLTKWSHVPWTPSGTYDSKTDMSTTLNKYVVRLGFGFVQFIPLGGNFHLFVNEDLGFLTSPMSDIEDPRLDGIKTNVSQYLKPTYISLRAGICFIPKSRYSKTPYKIFNGKYDR